MTAIYNWQLAIAINSLANIGQDLRSYRWHEQARRHLTTSVTSRPMTDKRVLHLGQLQPGKTREGPILVITGSRLRFGRLHFVKQRTCKTKSICIHKRCKEKQRAIETMHLTYSLSEHPVALLGGPIEWEYELDLLYRILTGKLVKELKQINGDEVLQALSLLSRITKERWWTRAWKFQEDYSSDILNS
ncbi:uncharacterized protein FFNC_15429 [Fusarium fujikuroi]|nr:uncharacterized protein FFNC_15429 [Fusarium fujikuroi]